MSGFDFDAAFEASAPAHFALLGGKTVTLARPHGLLDARGGAVTSLRLAANAAIGATTITVQPLSGTFKGKIPQDMLLAAGVKVSAEVEQKNPATQIVVPVVALAAALTAGTVWALPPGSSWEIADVLEFEDRVHLITYGQGSGAGGDRDRGHQSPKLAFPVANLPAGITPRAGDVVTWVRGKAQIVGTPKRRGDSVDVELEDPG